MKENRPASVFSWAALGAACVLSSIFLAAALPLIFIDYEQGRGAADQNFFHLPTIVSFARQWPHADLSVYASATTPGYHLLMAFVAQATGSVNERVLRLASVIFTLGLLWSIAWHAARRVGLCGSLLLCLPLACSIYIFSSGVWLLPDNLAWWTVLLALLAALARRIGWKSYAGALLLLCFAVMVRQNNLWIIAPLCVAAMWPTEQSTTLPKPSRQLLARGVLMAAMAIPAALILAAFFRLWHGMVPPDFQAGRNTMTPILSHRGANYAMPAVILATAGLLAPAYLGWFTRSTWPHRWRAAAIGACLGAVLAAAPVTSRDQGAGRWTGLWNIVPHAPMIGQRSILIIVLAIVGGAMLGFIFWSLAPRLRWIFLVSFLAFAAAQTANHQALQRYIDPFVIMVLVLAVCARANRDDASTARWIAALRLAPIGLALAEAAVTVVSLR